MKKYAKINLEISNICNLQCSFCPEVVREKQIMTVDLFHDVIRQIAPLTDQVCFHLMGDPLVHPKLSELVEICRKYETRIFLVTNGVLLREKQAELLLDPAFRQVNFSLHSFADNYGDRDPALYLERIFSFTERAFRERPDLYVNYRLWNLSDPRGGILADGISANGSTPNERMLSAIETRFGVSITRVPDVRRQKSHRLKERLYLHYDTEFVWPSLDLPTLGTSGSCYGLSSHFGILVDGTVVPCCLDKEGRIPLGNVKDRPIEEILASPKARGILEGFQRGKLTAELCQKCQYIERFRPVKKGKGSALERV